MFYGMVSTDSVGLVCRIKLKITYKFYFRTNSNIDTTIDLKTFLTNLTSNSSPTGKTSKFKFSEVKKLLFLCFFGFPIHISPN